MPGLLYLMRHISFKKEIAVMIQNATLQCVYTLLAKYSVPIAVKFSQTCPLPPDLPEADSIRAINQYWRDTLARFPRDTMVARSYLVDVCQLDEWISLLERGVIPEIFA